MSLEAFKAGLNARLSGIMTMMRLCLLLGHDNKKTFQATRCQKIQNCEVATISVTCHDGAKLG
jgi:hypothetical protein